MQSIKKISDTIRNGFPEFAFTRSDAFLWSPNAKTVYHPAISNQYDLWCLLHEVAHGLLNHTDYGLDVELVSHEAQAWERATHLAAQFNLIIDPDYIEDSLDTYRTWLHARSTCPDCGQTGLQTQNTYSCINCRCLWRANEARLCGLQRIKLQVRSQT